MARHKLTDDKVGMAGPECERGWKWGQFTEDQGDGGLPLRCGTNTQLAFATTQIALLIGITGNLGKESLKKI
jgi:hypothetical protein